MYSKGWLCKLHLGSLLLNGSHFLTKKTEGKGGKNKNNVYIMVNKARAVRRLCKGQQKPDQGHWTKAIAVTLSN